MRWAHVYYICGVTFILAASVAGGIETLTAGTDLTSELRVKVDKEYKSVDYIYNLTACR